MGSQVHQMDLVLARMLSQKKTRVFLLGTFFVKFHIFQQALCDKTDEVKLLQGTTCQSTQMKKSSGTGHATIIPHFSSFSLIVNTTSGVAVFFTVTVLFLPANPRSVNVAAQTPASSRFFILGRTAEGGGGV